MINGLPERLRALRLKYDLSQREAAERIGVSTSIISGYETGERTPSTEVILALSYLYHCSTDYLLGKKITASNDSLDVNGLTQEQVDALNALIKTMKD